MSSPQIKRPDLPEYMTWEELEQLPEEIAEQIELWNGRVVWLRRGPDEHQEFTNLLWSGLRRCARSNMTADPEQCWRVSTETNVFFGRTGKSDFVTPDFMIFRCLDEPYQYVRSDGVLLVGEVLSPSNSDADMELKKARYAAAGIPWYWEVTLATQQSAIAHVHAYVLAPDVAAPPGVTVLHQANYILAGTWSPSESEAIEIDHPFPIHIPWSELEF
ncbi:Uma2 family endonuclease [Nocardia sp. NPDC004604]|uniref:Uma2 family endonuclease n=1 Tax=Nocardia sp. NPDC004604 TaxID=3157013 RepID=UPI0033AEE5D4